jgi:hypothetical protein
MKKLLLPMLVPIAIGTMYVACNNQNEPTTVNEDTAEKWVINKVNEKSDNGKLFIDLPKETEWDITIFAAGSSKVLSNTMLQKEFTLSPGNYDLEIDHIKITGVPVEKGNNTRLKAGVLHIPNKTPWTLYDEAKQKVLINSSSTEARGLPIGKYKLTIKEEDHDIEIKDGKTVKY